MMEKEKQGKQQLLSLYELMDNWYSTREQDDARPIRQSTKDSYFRIIRLTKQWFEDTAITELPTEVIQNKFNALAEAGYSKSTINKVRIVLKQSYEYVINLDIALFKNPVTRSVVPIRAAEKEVFPLTIEQQKVVAEACMHDIYGHLFLFLLFTGVRRQELCDIQWGDYDKKNKTIKIRTSKTHSGIRVIPLLSLCDEIVKMQPHINEYIFNSKKGVKITPCVLRSTYDRIRKVTGVEELTNHVCRHTFATRLLETGAKEKAISVLLGHSSVTFTLDRYVKAQPEYLRSQIKLMDTSLFAISGNTKNHL